MRSMRAWLMRFGEIFGQQRRDRELAAELESHVQLHIDENLRAGMSPEEARRQALIHLGGVEQIKESYRDRRGIPWLETLAQDVRFGLRMLAKSPSLTAIVVITLALGIGVNAAIFSVINALFLHPPGISHAEGIVALRAKYEKLGLENIVVSVPDFAQIRDSKRIFSSAALEDAADFNYTGGDYPQRLRGARVSWQWFDVFEAKPVIGRVFSPSEDQPNANREVVLSYGAWQRWFGGDRSAVGRTIQLNEQPYRIIGVMGPEFHWPADADLWAPIGLPAESFGVNNTFNESYFAVARLRPGVSFSQASAYVRILAKRVTGNPASSFARNAGWDIFLMPITALVFGDLRAPILVLACAVALVLLIACANIAGLLLARAAGRSKELALRAALGASRIRLLGQALAENAVLGLAGILLGLVFAREGVRALTLAAPPGVMTGDFPLDGYVLLFTALVGIGSVLIFGTLPAWHTSQADPYSALRESGRSATGSRSRQNLRSFLVAAELALGLVLLTGTGLLLKSVARIGETNPGFQPEGVMTTALSCRLSNTTLPRNRSRFFRPSSTGYGTRRESLRRAPAILCHFPEAITPPVFRLRGTRQVPEHPARMAISAWLREDISARWGSRFCEAVFLRITTA